MACMVLFAASFYVYLINTTSMNGVKWREAETNVSTYGAAISELESTYFSLKHSVTIGMAYARGFENVKVVRFISAQKVGTVAIANEI